MEDNILLLDEEGNEVEFEVLSTFGVDNLVYAALMPIEGETDLIHILKIVEDENGDTMLIGIDDEDEFEAAISVYEELERESMTENNN